jgi:hypothetical protein
MRKTNLLSVKMAPVSRGKKLIQGLVKTPFKSLKKTKMNLSTQLLGVKKGNKVAKNKSLKRKCLIFKDHL